MKVSGLLIKMSWKYVPEPDSRVIFYKNAFAWPWRKVNIRVKENDDVPNLCGWGWYWKQMIWANNQWFEGVSFFLPPSSLTKYKFYYSPVNETTYWFKLKYFKRE